MENDREPMDSLNDGTASLSRTERLMYLHHNVSLCLINKQTLLLLLSYSLIAFNISIRKFCNGEKVIFAVLYL